jgi:hypothetical protein
MYWKNIFIFREIKFTLRRDPTDIQTTELKVICFVNKVVLFILNRLLINEQIITNIIILILLYFKMREVRIPLYY